MNIYRFVKYCRYIYRTYLSKYTVFVMVKKLLLFIYFRNQFRIRKILKLFEHQKKFSVLKLHDFALTNNVEWVEVYVKSNLKISFPYLINHTLLNNRSHQLISYSSPSIKFYKLKSMKVISRSNLLISGSDIIIPDFVDLKNDILRPELFHTIELSPDKHTAKISLPMESIQIKAGLNLVGQCSGNYAHWVSEILPKLAIFCLDEKLRNVPVIIDDWLHANMIESIKLIGGERDLIRLGAGESAFVETLYDFTSPSYIPFESRCYIETGVSPVPKSSRYVFSHESLNLLREKIQENTKRQHSARTISRPEFLFLSRRKAKTGQGRCVVNNSDIENIVKKNGYECVDLGDLSFEQQISLLDRAKSIVAPIGASLINLVFLKQKCNVLILSPIYDSADFFFYSNLLQMCGHNVAYLVGEQIIDEKIHIAHRDFYIDPGLLEMVLHNRLDRPRSV